MATEDLEMAVSVMAYPAITMRHGEVVCVAGFRTDRLWRPDWIRLFPFRVRDVPSEVRVHKWDIIRLRVLPSTNDARPESRRPVMDGLQTVGHLDTADNWASRKVLVDPHRGKTMRDVLSQSEADGTSLAVIESGEILDLDVTKRPTTELTALEEKARDAIAQGDLFSLDERVPLEPVPYDFHLVVRYPDDVEPRRLKIVDWEINQAFRRYRHGYAKPEEVVRRHWLEEVCGEDKDPVFFVGNMHRFPSQWLLLGIHWPRRS